MHISFAGHVLQACPECHYLSVHFFDDVIMCILCGWDKKRSEDSRPCSSAGAGVLELALPDMRPRSQRSRQRPRKAARKPRAKKAAASSKATQQAQG